VQDVEDDKWRVSRAGSVWDVEKVKGNATNVGKSARVSDFTFEITPHQPC
jgi:hypothetical protein